ncbi:MAG: hypothetical protein KKD39_06720 [Candidatus Altiarchaeota archaeon]|nr:hypothetical protein [Candidatus Altiarchaeota archaeon]
MIDALESYRLKYGGYPSSLKLLYPEYLGKTSAYRKISYASNTTYYELEYICMMGTYCDYNSNEKQWTYYD